MAFTLSQVDRKARSYTVSTLLNGATVPPSGTVQLGLIPPQQKSPTSSTVWTPVTYSSGSFSVLFAGPQADSTGAIVVTADADLWMLETDAPLVQAVKIERITVLGAGGSIPALPSTYVTSVNGKSGVATLTFSDVGADASGAATTAQAAAIAAAATDATTKANAAQSAATSTAATDATTKANAAQAAAIAAIPSMSTIAADPALRAAYAALKKVAATATAGGALVLNKHNPVDATAATVAMTLPTGGAEGAQISVGKVDSSANTVTVTGNIRGTPATTETLVGQYEALTFLADSAGSWWPTSGHKTKTWLNATYAAIAGTNTFTGTNKFLGQFSIGPNPAGQSGFGLQTLAKSDTFPWPSNPAQAMFELYHDGTVGNIFHLTSGPDISPTNAPALIALGVDSNRTGLYVHMRGDYGGGTGINIAVDQANTAGHYGMVVNGGKGGAPATWWQQNNDAGSSNAQPLAVFFAFQSFSAAQRMVEFRCPGTGVDGTTFSGTLAGYVRSQDGALIWQSVASFQPSATNVTPLLTVGLSGQTADLQQWNVSGTGTVAKVDKSGNIFGNTVLATAAGTFLGLYDTGGTVNSRRFQLAQSSGSLLITARNDDGTNKGTVFQVDQSGNQTVKDGANFLVGTTTGTKIGTATTQKLGFFNATPVAQPSGTPAAAVDAATTQALVNSLRSSLVSLGLVA